MVGEGSERSTDIPVIREALQLSQASVIKQEQFAKHSSLLKENGTPPIIELQILVERELLSIGTTCVELESVNTERVKDVSKKKP